ncbi:MAG: hypothetical protein ACKVRO_11120 [Micropepsaceae bacterium]
MNKMDILDKLLHAFSQKGDSQINEIMDRLERGEEHDRIAASVKASETLVDLAAAVRRFHGRSDELIDVSSTPAAWQRAKKPRE